MKSALRLLSLALGLTLVGCPEPRQMGGGVRVAQEGLAARMSVFAPEAPDSSAGKDADESTSQAGGAGGGASRGD